MFERCINQEPQRISCPLLLGKASIRLFKVDSGTGSWNQPWLPEMLVTSPVPDIKVTGRLGLHYTNYTTLQLQLHYTTTTAATTTAPHYVQQLWVR